MVNKFDFKLIPEINGLSPSQFVVEWIEKAELVYYLCGMKQIEQILPLCLSGGEFAVNLKLTVE